MADRGSILSYYCTEEYLDKYLGDFQIKDRPKRKMYRFINEENKMEVLLPSKQKDFTNKSTDSSVNKADQVRYPSRPMLIDKGTCTYI